MAEAEEAPAEEQPPADDQPADYEAPKEEAAAEDEAPKEEAPAKKIKVSKEKEKANDDDAEEDKGLKNKLNDQMQEEFEEQPEYAEEAPKEEAPAEEDKGPKEKEKANDDDAEEPKAEEPEPPKEEAKEEPKAEEVKEEPAKKKKKGKKKKKKAVAAGDCEAGTLWKEISKKSGNEINWYILKLKGKVGSGEDMECIEKGAGGVKEMVEFFTDKNKGIYFALLRVTTTDNAMSVRAKFVYMKFLGTNVKTMTKAKLTGSLGKIEEKFPCKHLSMDINEKCADDLQPERLARELLRVGGAHKPDKMSFGPDQDVDVTNM